MSGSDLVRWAHLRAQLRRYEGMLKMMTDHDAPESAIEMMCAKIAELRGQLGG